MHKIFSFGEALIDFIGTPAGNNLENSETFVKKPGGAPANVAVALSRLETPVSFVGKVGCDAFGSFLINTLMSEGVDTTRMLQSQNPAHQTSLAFVSLDQDKERHFSFYRSPGADTQLSRDELPDVLFSEPAIFHFGSISLIEGPTKDCCLSLLDEAAVNSLVSYDPNLRLNLWPSEDLCRSTVLETMNRADLLKLSEEELIFLSRESNFKNALTWIQAKYDGVLLISMGPKGAQAFVKGESIHVATQSCEVVDTTGAGDAFLGGFLAAISRLWEPGKPITLEHCKSGLELAVQAGTFAVQDYGAMSALPRWHQLDWKHK